MRRDLDELAAEGKLRRVHGGAVAIDERLSELHFDVKAVEAAEEAGFCPLLDEFISVCAYVALADAFYKFF